MWIEAIFPVDLHASGPSIEAMINQLTGYPGIGLAYFDSGRQLLIVRYDGEQQDRPSLRNLFGALAIPAILEPMAATAPEAAAAPVLTP